MPSKLSALLPWTKSPLIINAPMAGSATAPLAHAVTLAGGLGQIGSANDLSALAASLETLTTTSPPLSRTPSGHLPIGVGFLLFLASLDQAAQILALHRPAVIWLFAAKQTADYAVWTERVRHASPGSLVFVQIGSVADALQVAREAKPDVLVVQGADAGGHGLAKAAGLLSLLPEVRDALVAEGLGEEIMLVGAGGITDSRGAAAALALGAQGVVMGTRFLGARETELHAGWREAVLGAKDGGRGTVKGRVFDELRGESVWPVGYDGRGVANASSGDLERGVGIEEVRRLFKEASEGADGGFGTGGRAAMWAGTGVGLVTRVQGAGEIVEEVREGVARALEEARAML